MADAKEKRTTPALDWKIEEITSVDGTTQALKFTFAPIDESRRLVDSFSFTIRTPAPLDRILYAPKTIAAIIANIMKTLAEHAINFPIDADAFKTKAYACIVKQKFATSRLTLSETSDAKDNDPTIHNINLDTNAAIHARANDGLEFDITQDNHRGHPVICLSCHAKFTGTEQKTTKPLYFYVSDGDRHCLPLDAALGYLPGEHLAQYGAMIRDQFEGVPPQSGPQSGKEEDKRGPFQKARDTFITKDQYYALLQAAKLATQLGVLPKEVWTARAEAKKLTTLQELSEAVKKLAKIDGLLGDYGCELIHQIEHCQDAKATAALMAELKQLCDEQQFLPLDSPQACERLNRPQPGVDAETLEAIQKTQSQLRQTLLKALTTTAHRLEAEKKTATPEYKDVQTGITFITGLDTSIVLLRQMDKRRKEQQYWSDQECMRHLQVILKVIAEIQRLTGLEFDANTFANKLDECLTMHRIMAQSQTTIDSMVTKIDILDKKTGVSVADDFERATARIALAEYLMPTDAKEAHERYAQANKILVSILSSINTELNRASIIADQRKQLLILKIQALEAQANIAIATGDLETGYNAYLAAYLICNNNPSINNLAATIRQTLINHFSEYRGRVIEKYRKLMTTPMSQNATTILASGVDCCVLVIVMQKLLQDKERVRNALAANRVYQVDVEYPPDLTEHNTYQVLAAARDLMTTALSQLNSSAAQPTLSLETIFSGVLHILTTLRDPISVFPLYEAARSFAVTHNLRGQITALDKIIVEIQIPKLTQEIKDEKRREADDLHRQIEIAKQYMILSHYYKIMGNAEGMRSAQEQVEIRYTRVLGKIPSNSTSQTSRVTLLHPLQLRRLKIRALTLSGDLARFGADLKTAGYRYERALEENAKLVATDDCGYSYTLELLEKLGDISLENKQYDEAEKYYHQAVACLKEHQDSISNSANLATALNIKLQQIQELKKKTHPLVAPNRH